MDTLGVQKTLSETFSCALCSAMARNIFILEIQKIGIFVEKGGKIKGFQISCGIRDPAGLYNFNPAIPQSRGIEKMRDSAHCMYSSLKSKKKGFKQIHFEREKIQLGAIYSRE